MCGAVCAANAIDIRMNDDGFYRPFVNEDKCSGCGFCTKVCYKYDREIKITDETTINNIKAYAAQSFDEELLEDVTSGGIADAFAKEFIRQGYQCVGVVYNDDTHRAETVIASCIEDTNAFRGSKYIQTYSIEAFRKIVRSARNTKFAVFGLPCHIYAINRFVISRNLRDNFIFVDLFCHGCPSMHTWTKYEKRIKQSVNNATFSKVRFRSKAYGWGNFHVSVKTENGQSFVSTPKNDDFYSLFFSDYVLNDSCAECLLRSTMDYTDIRLGDFWGKRYLNDRRGVSAVSIATHRGNIFFETIKNRFRTKERTMHEILSAQSYGKTYHVDLKLRQAMLASLRDESKPLSDAVHLYYSKAGCATKVKRLLKTLNLFLPFDFVRLIKRIL